MGCTLLFLQLSALLKLEGMILMDQTLECCTYELAFGSPLLLCTFQIPLIGSTIYTTHEELWVINAILRITSMLLQIDFNNHSSSPLISGDLVMIKTLMPNPKVRMLSFDGIHLMFPLVGWPRCWYLDFGAHFSHTHPYMESSHFDASHLIHKVPSNHWWWSIRMLNMLFQNERFKQTNDLGLGNGCQERKSILG